MNRHFLTYDKTHIFNLLKYNRFYSDLEKSGFELKETTIDIHLGEHLHKYQTQYNNEYILDLILFGDYYNVLDKEDNDFISRLAGYSDKKEFVPHLIALRLSSYLTEKSEYSPNDNYTVSYNIPKKYCLAFNYDAYELVETSRHNYIFESVNKKFEEMRNILESEYSKSDYHYRPNDKIVYEAPPMFYRISNHNF